MLTKLNKAMNKLQIGILKSNGTCTGDVKVGRKKDGIMFGFVMKSINETLGICHVIVVTCMKPIMMEYQCGYCKCEPWLG